MTDAKETPAPADSTLSRVPDHVPPELVIDFDFYHPAEPIEDLQAMWVGMRARAPRGIFWTPRNGGHWVALLGKDIATIQQEYRRFSHTEMFLPANIPRTLTQVPIELDPPQSEPYRRIIMAPLMPNKMPPIVQYATQLTVELIEGFADRGECEFMREFATVLPIAVFLRLMNMPPEDREMLRDFAVGVVKSDTQERRAECWQGLQSYVTRWVSERRERPGDDLMSYVVHSTVENGRTVTNAEAIAMCFSLLLGGLDTVANMLGLFAIFLARNAGHRRQLIEHPQLINSATEELIRRHGIVASARRVVQDTHIQDVYLKKGDMIQIPNCLYGLDETIVEDPMKVDFTRKKSPHVAFTSGVHTCVGQHLARRELTIFLQQWLARIPDFQIKPGTTPVIESGLTGGPSRLELSWTPRAPN
jgi:cytochrome P450